MTTQAQKEVRLNAATKQQEAARIALEKYTKRLTKIEAQQNEGLQKLRDRKAQAEKDVALAAKHLEWVKGMPVEDEEEEETPAEGEVQLVPAEGEIGTEEVLSQEELAVEDNPESHVDATPDLTAPESTEETSEAPAEPTEEPSNGRGRGRGRKDVAQG